MIEVLKSVEFPEIFSSNQFHQRFRELYGDQHPYSGVQAVIYNYCKKHRLIISNKGKNGTKMHEYQNPFYGKIDDQDE